MFLAENQVFDPGLHRYRRNIGARAGRGVLRTTPSEKQGRRGRRERERDGRRTRMRRIIGGRSMRRPCKRRQRNASQRSDISFLAHCNSKQLGASEKSAEKLRRSAKVSQFSWLSSSEVRRNNNLMIRTWHCVPILACTRLD